MGEYARRISDGQEVKIGTCEEMMYIRYEDRAKVEKLPNSLDAATCKNLLWRIPFPDEDNIKIGEYEPYHRGQKLYKVTEKPSRYHPGVIDHDYEYMSNKESIEYPGIIQLSHASGILVNLNCYHGEKLPENTKDVQFHYNGRDPCAYELRYVKNSDEGMKAIVGCRFCGHMWRFDIADVLDWIPDIILRERIRGYQSLPAPMMEVEA